MNFLDRSINKLYKSYKKCSVEYHAGGFFIRKHALYFFVQSNDRVIFIEKQEGLHPFDNDYYKFLSEDLIKGKIFILKSITNNIATFNDGMNEIKIMPSVFSENITENTITEILVDFGEAVQYVLFLEFDSSESLKKFDLDN